MPKTQVNTQAKRSLAKFEKVSWRDNEPTAMVDWSQVEAHDLMNLLLSVTRSGGALILGLTSDGGAFSVCILLDDSKIREYPHTPAEFATFSKAVVEELA